MKATAYTLAHNITSCTYPRVDFWLAVSVLLLKGEGPLKLLLPSGVRNWGVCDGATAHFFGQNSA